VKGLCQGMGMRITTMSVAGAQAPQGQTRIDRPRAVFELPGTAKAEARRTEAARPSQATAGLETLLAVQGLMPEDRQEKRRRAVKRGHDALNLLDDLKLALLSGEESPVALLRLRSLTAARTEGTGDDRLDGVLAEIDLRAQVELAKREVARSAI
jgi:Class II flagellar assembly regulator